MSNSIREHTACANEYSKGNILKILDILIDNIFVEFGGRVLQQPVSMTTGTHCAPLLADLFLYSYEAEFIQELLSITKNKLARSFNIISALFR